MALALAAGIASVALVVGPVPVEGLPLPEREVPTSTALVLIRSRLLTEQRLIFELRRSQRSGGDRRLALETASPRSRAQAGGPTSPTYGTGACGGDLPPCSVMMCESGGSLTIRNRSGSSATGKWQILRGTWNGYGGYREAKDAPESVQDAKAREIYAGGAGRRQWVC